MTFWPRGSAFRERIIPSSPESLDARGPREGATLKDMSDVGDDGPNDNFQTHINIFNIIILQCMPCTTCLVYIMCIVLHRIFYMPSSLFVVVAIWKSPRAGAASSAESGRSLRGHSDGTPGAETVLDILVLSLRILGCLLNMNGQQGLERLIGLT